jgi:Ca2+-binding RTX toxin-like protein
VSRVARCILALGAMSLLGPPAAVQGATVSAGPYTEPAGTPREESCWDRCDQLTVWVQAQPGERNLIGVVVDGGEVVVSDGGAALTAGPGCVETIAGSLRCARAADLVVDAGDGDDRITSLDVPGLLRGGPGADVVVGLGSVVGGEGDDLLTTVGSDPTRATSPLMALAVGGPGRDVISALDGLRPSGLGSEGDDVLLLGGPGDDSIVGGSGVTTVQGGEGNDTIRGGAGQSWIYGGPGDDDLRGSTYAKGEAGDDRIHGTDRRDRLRGGPGDDAISGGAGHDDIRSDAGADRVAARDHQPDRIDCGGDRDRLIVDRIDDLSRCRR